MGLDYFVYAYLRDDGTPYYIGKGKRDRATNPNHRINLPRDKSKIVYWQKGISEEAAFYFEKAYIKLFGRKDNGTGILRNLTDGGEGSGRIVSSETKEKLSDYYRGRSYEEIYGPEKAAEMRRLRSEKTKGRVVSQDTKKKISKSLKGKPLPTETKRKISEGQKRFHRTPKWER